MAKTRPDGSPLTPNDREYWEQPYTFQEFPKAMFRFATTTDGSVKLNPDWSPELDTGTVATRGEEAAAKADGWFDNQPDAIAAGKRALQEQQRLDREAADRRFIDSEKRRIELKKQARLEMRGVGPVQAQRLGRATTIEAAAHASALESGDVTTRPSVVAPTPIRALKVSAGTIKWRRARVRSHCNDHDCTQTQLARQLTMDDSALRALVREDRSGSKWTDKKQRALLKVLGVSHLDWYAKR